MTTEPAPLSATCPACLAAPGQPCIATSSDLPREHLHRLRGLAAAERLTRCDTCTGSGWQPSGQGPADPRLIVCQVCGASPEVWCSEAGEERGNLHAVRWRAANLGLGPCGACDGIGWRPEDPSDLRERP